MRIWKKSLYDYYGEEPSPSCAGSICGSESESETDDLKSDGASDASLKTIDFNSSASSVKTPDSKTSVSTNDSTPKLTRNVGGILMLKLDESPKSIFSISILNQN